MKIFFCLFTLALLTFSCRRHDCFDLPDPTLFEFVDLTGQNVIKDSASFLSATFIMEDIGDTLFRSIQYSITSDKKLAAKELGWYYGIKKYRVFFTPDTVVYFFVYSSKKSSSSCDNSFKIDSISFINMSASKKANFYQVIVK